MISYTYIEAITRGFPETIFSLDDITAGYDAINWISGPVPTQEELDTWIFNQLKLDMWELIKTERDRRKLDGGYTAGGNWFHSDTTSRIQQLALVMMGAGIPPNLYWKTMSGSFVIMTQTLASQIFQAAASSDVAIFTAAEQKKAAMLASPDPGSYNYLTGWPLAYGE